MTKKEIESFLGEDWTKFQSLTIEALRSDVCLLNSTNESILSNSGKQLRPILSLLMARACSGTGTVTESSLCYAAASELLHNATLLHDDVADCSEVRRGKPTVMSILGPSASVLVGDFWLVKSMNMVLRASRDDDAVREEFSRTLSDLAEGEMLQLQKSDTGDTTEEDYLRIIYCKTASLFEATCFSAASSVNAPEEYKAMAKEFGRCLGMAFQIKDDILDYFGADLGKPVGVDLHEKKITLPLLGALQNADADVQESVRRMVCQIDACPDNYERIIDFVREKSGRAYAEARLDEYVQKAVDVLDILPESEEKSILKEMSRYVGRRNI